MKRALIFGMLITSLTGLLLAQGLWSNHTPIQRVDPKIPPPLSMIQAYGLAETYLGKATNQFWCVAGKCEIDWGTTTVTHWEFAFSSTNGESTNILVFFDRGVVHRHGAELVK